MFQFRFLYKAFLNVRYRKQIIVKTISNFLIFFSLLLLFRVFHKPVYYEIRYFFDRLSGVEYKISLKKRESGRLSSIFKRKKIKFLVPKDESFSIVIPKIAANSNIISNVDAADEKEYLKALKRGVAHAKGTAFPGEGGHIYLFAHSTDYFWNVGVYNAVFYLLYKLEKGDEVNLFYKGKRYVYKVVDKRIVDPKQVEYLTRKTNREFLTLQTCWPPGTTWKRLLIFAVRK